LAERDVVIRRQAVAGVHYQIWCGPQIVGDRLPAAGLTFRAGMGVIRGRLSGCCRSLSTRDP
jgi:hypothetical protein